MVSPETSQPALLAPGPDGRPLRAPQRGAEVIAEPLRSRWSPSVFDPAHRLDREQLTTLLTAARWAPSAGNAQPWAMVVCERGGSGHAALVATLSRGNAGWVPRAAAVFVLAARVGIDADGNEPSPYACYDAGQAAAHLTLQARAMDLHAHQFAGFDHAAFAEAVGIPAEYAVLSGIAVGVLGDLDDVDERTAARDARPRTRDPLARWAFDERWGRGWPA